jgi:hypothetical protein
MLPLACMVYFSPSCTSSGLRLLVVPMFGHLTLGKGRFYSDVSLQTLCRVFNFRGFSDVVRSVVRGPLSAR